MMMVMLFPHLIDTFGVEMTFSSLPLAFTFHLLMSSSIPAVLIFLFLFFTHLPWSLLPSFVFLLSFMFAIRHFEIYKVPYK